MSRRTLALMIAGSLISGVASAQKEPDPAPAPAGEEKPDFSKPPVPDLPPPEDGGPNAFVHTTDQVIDLFRDRIKKNPKDFISYRYLGEAFERKARETGDLASYEQAELAFRKAVELLPGYARAESGLAAVLCSRHKFAEGLAIAERLVRADPKNIDALSTIGDAQLELGRYDEAEASFARLYKLAPIPEVLARQANLASQRGRTDEALSLLTRAADEARKVRGKPADAAWYMALRGDIAFTAGRIDEAEKAFQAVPAGVDPYHDATFGLARVEAARGHLDAALALARKAVEIGPDPHMLAALGDLYLAAGKPDLAAPVFDRLDKMTRGKPEYLRARAMFLADHDRDLSQALSLAQEDLVQRKDVYGHDALAWALYKNGRFEDASRAMAEALKPGARDPLLDFHAGMIALRLGDRARAKDFLEKALRLNPRFDPRHADEAKKALEGLGQAKGT